MARSTADPVRGGRLKLAAVVALAVLALAVGPEGPAATGLVVKVSGNHLVDGSGNTLRLLGVNRSGFEFACAQGWAFTEGPTDAAAVAAIAAWHVNAVRVPLNEGCWLGLSSLPPDYTGQPYRNEVKGFVQRLHAAGLYVILELHWNAPGSEQAMGQQVMPDADHSPAFWKSVARTFKSDRAVIFDVYNEPHDVSWSCWRDGCTTTGGWKAAGMKHLVKAIRGTGAKQPIMLGGLAWSNDLSGWLQWRPAGSGLVAAFHTYNFNGCSTEACWNTQVAPVAATVPVVTGEFGENDCAHGYSDSYMDWADAHGVSYLGWTWNPWNCNDGPALISDWAGTPTPYGAGLHDHLAP